MVFRPLSAPVTPVGSLPPLPGHSKKYDVTLPPNELERVYSRQESKALGQVQDWGHRYLKADSAYQHSKGEKACIFVLDTAGQYDHDDLKSNVLSQYAKNFSDAPSPVDGHGHSHHCAGIAAAANNDTGIIGVAPEAKLVPVKVLNDSGSGQWDWIASAIRYVADIEGLPYKKIISMSLGGSGSNPLVVSALDYAISKGVFIVAAAGNSGYQEGKDSVNFPGSHEPVIAVASLDEDGKTSSFSSGGPFVDLAAPGRNVYSTFKGNAYAKMSGTSMACPHVAGVVALVLSAHAEITTQAQLVEYLRKYATDLLTPGFDPRTGAGAPVVDKYFPAAF